MRFSLINPPWNFEKSIYFGCREPHLPLEFAYARVLLENKGHEVQIVDGQMEELAVGEIRERVADFKADISVITTAPSYLFWRCAPPELRMPIHVVAEVKDVSGVTACVGPHASTTPRATLKKTGADVVIAGECEEVIASLADNWQDSPSLCFRSGENVVTPHKLSAANVAELPALRWERDYLARHRHHHHRFDSAPRGPGAEMETSRGCPYRCTFCAKANFRDLFRRRPIPVIEQELDGLIASGVEYVYFIDEIFLPFRDVLEALRKRRIHFGIQTRIDLWPEGMIDLLGAAGCVSVEAGVESITEARRAALNKRCKITTDRMTELLIYAKQRIPFVQANLLNSRDDAPEDVECWREHLRANGVWANEPVPLFPYPGSPDYTARWGAPDDSAWERAHDFYLGQFTEFSDIQDQRPSALVQLESTSAVPHD